MVRRVSAAICFSRTSARPASESPDLANTKAYGWDKAGHAKRAEVGLGLSGSCGCSGLIAGSWRVLVGVAGGLVDAAAGQPPGHDAGLGLFEVPAGGLLGFVVVPADRRVHYITTHLSCGSRRPVHQTWPDTGQLTSDSLPSGSSMATPQWSRPSSLSTRTSEAPSPLGARVIASPRGRWPPSAPDCELPGAGLWSVWHRLPHTFPP